MLSLRHKLLVAVRQLGIDLPQLGVVSLALVYRNDEFVDLIDGFIYLSFIEQASSIFKKLYQSLLRETLACTYTFLLLYICIMIICVCIIRVSMGMCVYIILYECVCVCVCVCVYVCICTMSMCSLTGETTSSDTALSSITFGESF